jgi:hypothetical protein
MKKSLLVGSLACLVLLVQSALGHEIRLRSFLNGASENPAVPSDGLGTSLVTFDLDLLTMRVETSFEDLEDTTLQAHIHCCADAPANVGVATQLPSFTGFPLGVTAGSMDTTFDMSLASSYNPAFVTANTNIDGAFNALLNGLIDGRAYFNIHSSFRQSGEIRGYYTVVPEPSCAMLLLLGAAGFVVRRRR